MKTISNDERYKNYLLDLGLLLKEYAIEAKANRDTQRKGEGQSFYAGELMAFHRIVSLVQQQARAFGISLEDLRLEDIQPDRDLV